MTQFMRMVGGLALAALMTACGGGGGSPGTTTSGTGTTPSGTGTTTTVTGTTTAAATPTVILRLVNSAGSTVSNNAVTAGSIVYAQATVKDAAGVPVANKLVVFVSGSNLVGFQPVTGQVLTDSSGVAKVQLVPTSLTAAGAETLTVNSTVAGTNLSASMDIQTSPANVTLSNFVPSQNTLSAFQSTLVSVDVAVNGAAAVSTPVQVGFASNCGTFSPAQSTSNSSGKAVTTFQASGCTGGTATLSASAVGATAIQAAVTVQTALPTNMLFVSATPSTIFTSQASFGIKQSIVIFKVVDASGNAVGASTNVQVSLSSSAIASGVVFADTNSTTPKVVATDVNGEIAVIVKSGSVPTPLSLDAKLVSNPLVAASSAGLSVNSGQPVQSFFSLSASTFNIEGWSFDNESTNVNVLVADRLGQPVPAGTPISFITEGGQITASCSVVIDANNKSGCTVTLVSQAFRPGNGRVTVLAYTEGEEAFIDANGNNKYDVGETFYDMGQPFLDSNENGVWDLSPAEQKVGDASTSGAGIGSLPCADHQFLVANVANTCDGAWGTTRVRAQAVIVFSTSFAKFPTFFDISPSGISLVLSDQNDNSMPFGTAVTATISGGVNCGVKEVIPATVPNGTNPTQHRVIISSGSAPTDTCSGAEVSIKATTLKGNATLLGSVVIP
jgi:hypothetical protein